MGRAWRRWLWALAQHRRELEERFRLSSWMDLIHGQQTRRSTKLVFCAWRDRANTARGRLVWADVLQAGEPQGGHSSGWEILMGRVDRRVLLLGAMLGWRREASRTRAEAAESALEALKAQNGRTDILMTEGAILGAGPYSQLLREHEHWEHLSPQNPRRIQHDRALKASRAVEGQHFSVNYASLSNAFTPPADTTSLRNNDKGQPFGKGRRWPSVELGPQLLSRCPWPRPCCIA